MSWILVIIMGGLLGASDIKFVSMTEKQCKKSVDLFRPLKGKVGAGCVGPNGESYTLDDPQRTTP